MAEQTTEKIAYFTKQTQRRLFSDGGGCPNCGCRRFVKRDAKALVTELRECQQCSLYYRFPTDSVDDNRDYYQKTYKQGFTTDMPDDATLIRLQEKNFAGHEKSYAFIIELLKKLGVANGSRIFDYGCSWGFGSWQFSQSEFDVISFEISIERAAFARNKLGVNCFHSLEQLEARLDLDRSFDVFFSNHVMEHVPSPAKAIALARRLVRPAGLFIAITPNGSLGYREVSPKAWHQFWGKVHPNLISDTFWAAAFREHDHFVGALPSGVAEAEVWAKKGGRILAAQRDPELLCVAML